MIIATRTELWPWPAETGRTRTQIGGIWVEWSGTQPTPAELAAYLTPPKPRPLLSIVSDLNALTPTQKGLVWTDLLSGTPPKWQLSQGPNSGAIAALAELLILTAPFVGSMVAADVLGAQTLAVATYLLDNPKYLVNPPFAPTININGWA